MVFSGFFLESVARVIKGNTGGNCGAPRGNPVHHPLPYRAMQRQPAGQSGRRLQTGRESSGAASMQRTRAGLQHDTVSERTIPTAHHRSLRIFTVFLNSYFAVSDAERTACPRRDRSKQPKANTGRMTPRGREKGSIFCRFAFA